MIGLLLGLLIGLAMGTTGVGGGTLTAPALMLFLGEPASQAIGTALLFSSAARLFAALFYVRRRQIGFHALGYLLVGGAPGVVAGTAIMLFLRIEQPRIAIAILGAAVILAAGFSLLRPLLPLRGHEDKPKALSVFGFLIALSVGVSSAGAGALGTLVLFNCAKLDPSTVVGTSLLFGFVISAVSGVLHIAFGKIDFAILIQLMAGGVLGASAGSCLVVVLPGRALRATVLVGALLLGSVLLRKGLGGVF